MGSEEWIGESDENAIVWTTVPMAGTGSVSERSQKDMAAFQKIIVTQLVVTPPASGNIAIRIQHSSDYGIRSSPTWQTLLFFNAVNANSPASELTQTEVAESFHGYIRVQSKCSEADQTVKFDVDIEGK